eukprot:3830595-Amphidinium_carterae.1
MERERLGSAGPSLSYPKCTACGARLASTTSRSGVSDAGLGVRYRLENVRLMKPSTWPLRLRLGTPAVSTKQ